MANPYLTLSEAPLWVTDLQDRRRLRRMDRRELQAATTPTVAEMAGAFEGGPDSVQWLRHQRQGTDDA